MNSSSYSYSKWVSGIQSEDEFVIFNIGPMWATFVDALKKEFYPVGKYDDQYTGWTTLRRERYHLVIEYTIIFHILRWKLGIRDFENHLDLKYHNALHRYIQTKMNFLNMSSLGALINMLSILSKIWRKGIRKVSGLQVCYNKILKKVA